MRLIKYGLFLAGILVSFVVSVIAVSGLRYLFDSYFYLYGMPFSPGVMSTIAWIIIATMTALLTFCVEKILKLPKMPVVLITLLVFGLSFSPRIFLKPSFVDDVDTVPAVTTDTKLIYKDPDVGFTFEYPSAFPIDKDRTIVGKQNINISILQMDKLDEETEGRYTKEQAVGDEISIYKGKTVQNDFTGWSVESIKPPYTNFGNIVSVGEGKKIQTFMVLGRFEECNVTLERRAFFFHNNYVVTITVYGDEDAARISMPRFFETSKSCSKSKWISQMNFYQAVIAGQGSPQVREWYNTFDQVIGSLQFIAQSTGSVEEKELIPLVRLKLKLSPQAIIGVEKIEGSRGNQQSYGQLG